MRHRRSIFSFLLILLALGGCAVIPKGPGVMVLPGPGKPFEQFQADDILCRQWAGQRIGLSPQEVANKNTAIGAGVGTVIGGAAGAAIGAASGNAGAGAAIGAGTGLLIGAATGAESGQVYGRDAQHRYDIAYMQCMYAKGNQIPGVIQRARRARRFQPPPPPPYLSPAPPPPYPGPVPPPPFEPPPAR